MAPKVAIVYYSLYGHIATVAKAVKSGVEKAGGKVDVFQVPETLNSDILTKMHAPPKDSSVPEITPEILKNYDAFLFGIPTRYGNFPAQWKAFWDATGQLWATGGLYHKFAGVFVSTGTPGGGQETTVINALSTLSHHGIIYVPLGYGAVFPQVTNLDEVHGSSPWGAGTFAGPTGARQPTKLELEIAAAQGSEFYKVVSSHKF